MSPLSNLLERRYNMKIGDIVKHKSGGPVMTVSEIDDEGGIGCTFWAEVHEEFVEHWFGEEELTPELS